MKAVSGDGDSWVEGMGQWASGDMLQPADLLQFMPSSGHAMGPWPDHVLVREAYDLLYEDFVRREGKGVKGVTLMGSRGVGLKAAICVFMKRSVICLTIACVEVPCSDELRNNVA